MGIITRTTIAELLDPSLMDGNENAGQKRTVRDVGVAGSNPATPTKISRDKSFRISSV